MELMKKILYNKTKSDLTPGLTGFSILRYSTMIGEGGHMPPRVNRVNTLKILILRTFFLRLKQKSDIFLKKK